ncbi:MAG: hypothetical protein ACYT04_27585, partial [Nostoc sp.]
MFWNEKKRKGNPDLRLQAPCSSTALRVRQSLQRGEPPQRAGSPIEQIEKELFSLLLPTSFKPLRFCSVKDDQKLRERILTLPVMMAVVLSLVYRQSVFLGV